MPEGNALTHGISPILTDMAISFLPDYSNLIARQVFPNVPVAAPSGQYNYWTQDDFLRQDAKKLGNREAAPEVDFSTSTGTYSVSAYGSAASWTNREGSEAAIGGIDPQDLINAKLQLTVGKSLLALESQTSTLIQTAANWYGTAAGVASGPSGAQFLQFDSASSDPVQTVLAWRRNFHKNNGIYFPNTMILPGYIFDALQSNAALKDRIKYTGTQGDPTEITLNMLKALFKIPNILVPEGAYNTAKQGQTKSISYFWGNNVWMGHVAPTAGKYTPSAGYHYSWTGATNQGLPGGMASTGGPQNMGSVRNAEGLFVERYQTVRPKLDWVETTIWTTPNVTSSDLGFLFTNVLGTTP